jgi:hypothetical protein
MKLPLPVAGRWSLAILTLLLLWPGAMAFTTSPVVISPSGVLNPNDPVNISYTVYAASGTAFPSYDDIQFVTELDDPVWSYTVVVDGVENVRPPERGKTLTISGFELNYENKVEVVIKVNLKAHVPATAAPGANKMMIKIQELDARSNVLQYSVVTVDHLIGQPTPTPTPAFGSIIITSEPSGAAVYLDNAIKGITPVTLEGIPNGAHHLLLRFEGYTDYTSDVSVMAGSRNISAVLVQKGATPTSSPASGTPAATGIPGSGPTVTGTQATTMPPASATTGTLSVTTDPPGALVYIDNEMKGISPATIPGLSAGKHSVTLIMDGYQDFKTTTEIVPGTTSEFVTGLAKPKTVPGFTVAGSLVALGLCGALLAWGKRKA